MTSTKITMRSIDYTEDDIYLNTSDLGLDMLVKGKHEQMVKCVKYCEKNSFDKNAIIIKRVWENIKKATKDGTDKIHGVEPVWSRLSDDIFIFYAVRYTMFKKPIPIMEIPRAKELLAESNQDPCEVD